MKSGANTDESATKQVGVNACVLGHLKSYPLRAADALQLSAALIWCNRHPRGKTFVCDDTKLLEAAEKEGFNVIKM